MTKEEFWRKVDIQEPDHCWEWQGFIETTGYGRICSPSGVKGGPRIWAAHRLAYMFHYDVEPGNQFVLHSCDNPRCVNPNHLRLGTQLENMRDKIERGRLRVPIGTEAKNAKLDEGKVAKIRRDYSRARYGDISKAARDYGVSRRLIEMVLDGKRWKHVQ